MFSHLSMCVDLCAQGDDCKSFSSAKENIKILEVDRKTFSPKLYRDTHVRTKLFEPRRCKVKGVIADSI